MNRKQKIRLSAIVSILVILSIAASLVLFALKQNINLFYTPTQLLETQLTPEQHVRIGGYVKKQSVHYDASGQNVWFVITDRVHEITVNYHGVLPNLFREGQTVIVTGKWDQQALLAQEVLAKHDEKYMPGPLKNLKKGNGYGA